MCIRDSFEVTHHDGSDAPIVVIITHRMSSVRSADQIAVLDGGRLVEHGTHDELLARQGHYHRMFQRQASAYRD